jgi:transcriptional regulator GlxA family with amidase domain
MLAATRMSIDEVARASGFAGANAFTRAFRARFRHTPRAERARGQRVNVAAKSAKRG